MATSKVPRACYPRSTACTSNRSIRSFRRERCGACRTRSQARSRDSIRFRSSRRQPSWENFSPVCLTDLGGPPLHESHCANGGPHPRSRWREDETRTWRLCRDSESLRGNGLKSNGADRLFWRPQVQRSRCAKRVARCLGRCRSSDAVQAGKRSSAQRS